MMQIKLKHMQTLSPPYDKLINKNIHDTFINKKIKIN